MSDFQGASSREQKREREAEVQPRKTKARTDPYAYMVENENEADATKEMLRTCKTLGEANKYMSDMERKCGGWDGFRRTWPLFEGAPCAEHPFPEMFDGYKRNLLRLVTWAWPPELVLEHVKGLSAEALAEQVNERDEVGWVFGVLY